MGQEKLGPYIVRLSKDCFPLGEDSLALGEFATVRPNWRVCDLGCGGGTLLFLLLRREKSLNMTGVELNGSAAQCARENFAANGLEAEILTADLRQPGLLPNEGYELAVSNPPYFPVGTGQKMVELTRSEKFCSLDELCITAKRILRTGGRFALVHRPERLADVLCSLRGNRLEPKRLQFLAHTAEHGPSSVLVEAVKNGRPGLEVMPPLLHESGS